MWGRRRPSIFDIFENFFGGSPFGEEESGEDWFRAPFDEMIRRFEETEPTEYDESGEEKTTSGETRRYGPYVYGFSYTAEPGKEPTLREFGNIRPSTRARGIEPSEGREPLVDIMDEKDKYKIFVELPGVDKEKVKLNAADSCIQIKTEDEKKFSKRIDLDSEVDPDSAKASYKNGVLTVEISKKQIKGKEINIE